MPASGDHAGETPVPVPYPPPAARVDVIHAPPPELSDPVWVDGQWLWRGRRWVWEAGQWWQRDERQDYARPMVVRRSDGQLVWFAGAFRTRRSPLPQPSESPEAPR